MVGLIAILVQLIHLRVVWLDYRQAARMPGDTRAHRIVAMGRFIQSCLWVVGTIGLTVAAAYMRVNRDEEALVLGSSTFILILGLTLAVEVAIKVRARNAQGYSARAWRRHR